MGGEDSRSFLCLRAKVMRRILIDHAREMQTLSRGGDLDRIPLSDDLAWVNIGSPELLDLDAPWTSLAFGCLQGRTVELRCFLGCTVEETAD